jgi:hypothetical protein
MPEGAVYVGRPTLFGNPWTVRDAVGWDIPAADRQAWAVRMYREELDHGGLLSDWGGRVHDDRWLEMADLVETLPQDIGKRRLPVGAAAVPASPARRHRPRLLVPARSAVPRRRAHRTAGRGMTRTEARRLFPERFRKAMQQKGITR